MEISFLREGKGIYVGESSRSLYERTREHVADRVGRKEESHQVKHWLLDHGELKEPPEFKFRLVRSFKDPMSRQLSEDVRIELRGNDILNSRAEYNRSRVPRLRVDLEGWEKTKSKTPTIQVEECHEQDYETSLTLSDLKRKGSNDEENKQRKPKRIKLDKLKRWGESLTEDNVDENLPEGWWQKEQVIENETVSTGSRVQGSDLTTDENNKKKKFK